MTAIPGGFATLLWNSSGIDAPCSLVERADSGTMTTVVANMNTVYNSNSYHTNSIHYYPSDNTYTLGDRNPNLYVKVSRTGQLIWQLGGTNPKDAAKQFSGGRHLVGQPRTPPARRRNVRAVQQRLDDGRPSSAMRMFKLNTVEHDGDARPHVHGERREQQRHGRRPVASPTGTSW